MTRRGTHGQGVFPEDNQGSEAAPVLYGVPILAPPAGSQRVRLAALSASTLWGFWHGRPPPPRSLSCWSARPGIAARSSATPLVPPLGCGRRPAGGKVVISGAQDSACALVRRITQNAFQQSSIWTGEQARKTRPPALFGLAACVRSNINLFYFGQEASISFKTVSREAAPDT